MDRPVEVQPLVLVVAAEQGTTRSLVSMLAMNGFRSLRAGLGGGLARALSHAPDLILFDASQHGIDSVGVTARLREESTVPILVILVHDEPERGAILDAGANDYLERPFGPADLVSRMRVWLRQATQSRRAKSAAEPGRDRLRLDRERRALFVEGREVHITPLECKLVTVLAQSTMRPLSEERILHAVWGPDASPPVHYLRTLVRQLRQKIERDPARPVHLVNHPGSGYRLKLS
jgi:two-component system, OmpR family, KDP operon response regulator KdpE